MALKEGQSVMKCPKCGIEMKRETAGRWVCRNPKCNMSKGGKEHGNEG
jgi:ribosomal protein L37AE/L43A